MTTFAGDESGDTSFHFDLGTSRHFVVAFISTGQPDELRQAVVRFRQQHSLPSQYEFSFYHATARGLKADFFAMLARQAFSAWILVADKQTLPDMFKALSGNTVYLFFVSELIRAIPNDEKRRATLLLDEFGSVNKTIVELTRTMKALSISKGFKRITAKRSKSDDLIQVADMVAGAALRQFEKGDDSHMQVIRSRVALLFRYGVT